MELSEIIQEINEMLKDQKLSKLTVHDEHMLLRSISSVFREYRKTGVLDYMPEFYLDSDSTGSMIVKLQDDSKEI